MGLFWKKDLVYDKDKCQNAVEALENTKQIIEGTAPSIIKEMNAINGAKGFLEYCS